MIIYHGSQSLILKPEHGTGNKYNDYGQGFYCTESLPLAKEWACTEYSSGYVSEYDFNIDGLKVLHLSAPPYNVLNWLAILMENRAVRLSTPIMELGKKWLRQHFLPELNDIDVIVGHRADDSYFTFARAFVNNEISVSQLSMAIKLGGLGEQIFLKSPLAFDALRYVHAIPIERDVYYPRRKARDEMARENFRRIQAENDLNGLFMRDILKEEITPDDPRLQ